MTQSISSAQRLGFQPVELLGRWRVDESATVAHEAERLNVSTAQMRRDLEWSGYLAVTLAFEERAFSLTYDGETAPRHVATYTRASGIPCGINQIWLQFTWDEMMAQPFQYLLVTQHGPNHIEVEWPNDRFIHCRRQP